jgi:hypothetical protein
MSGGTMRLGEALALALLIAPAIVDPRRPQLHRPRA